MKQILAISLCLLFSCQPAKKEAEEEVVDSKTLKDEVFALHDEVMPMMGDLRKVRKSLMSQVDSIQGTDSERTAALIEASEALNVANEGMMVWMRNFDPNFEGTDGEVLKYLTAQKTSIEEVNKNMKETLKKGEELLSAN